MLKVKIINKSKNPNPSFATEFAAGMDLYANLDEALTLQPLKRALIPTGIFIELPAKYQAEIRPRSGLAYKHGITVLNSPGTIDADYRGEIKVLLVNLSDEAFTIESGDRIAQMLITEYNRIEWENVEELNDSCRAAGGFGSTGKK